VLSMTSCCTGLTFHEEALVTRIVRDHMRICLCGSTRFLASFIRWNAILTRAGMIVHSVGLVIPKAEKDAADSIGGQLDMVHRHKILDSHAILVLDVKGYIGTSTRMEIECAKANGVMVHSLSDFDCHVQEVPLEEVLRDCLSIEMGVMYRDDGLIKDYVPWCRVDR